MWCYTLLLAVQLYHFASSFSMVFVVWWTLLTAKDKTLELKRNYMIFIDYNARTMSNMRCCLIAIINELYKWHLCCLFFLFFIFFKWKSLLVYWSRKVSWNNEFFYIHFCTLWIPLFLRVGCLSNVNLYPRLEDELVWTNWISGLKEYFFDWVYIYIYIYTHTHNERGRVESWISLLERVGSINWAIRLLT